MVPEQATRAKLVVTVPVAASDVHWSKLEQDVQLLKR
jgi:hypothetical protein